MRCYLTYPAEIFRRTGFTHLHFTMFLLRGNGDKRTFIRLFIVLIAFGLCMNYFMFWYHSSQTNGQCLFESEGNPNSQEMCLDGVFQGFSTDAGLGNALFELISFIGICQDTLRLPLITDNKTLSRIEDLKKYLPGLHSFMKRAEGNKKVCKCATAVIETENACCRHDISTTTKIKDSKESTIRFRGIFTQSFKYFKHIPLNVLHNLLAAPRTIMEQAESLFPTEALESNSTKICVHLRHGDFVTSPLVLPSSEEFTMAALDHLSNSTFGNTTILTFSDDVNVTKSYFEFYDNVYHAAFDPSRPSNVEWEFSKQHCDVFLLTAPVSTYGWWMAYLSKGQKVYYNREFSKPFGIDKQLRPEDFWPSQWIPLQLYRTFGEVKEEPWEFSEYI